MKKIEFVHLNNTMYKFLTKGTVAAEIPSTEELMSLTQIGNSRRIAIKCGYSVLKYGENYCKKTGRDLSSSRMKEVIFFLDKSVYSQETIVLILKNEDIAHPIGSLEFSLKHKEMKPFLINSHIFSKLFHKDF